MLSRYLFAISVSLPVVSSVSAAEWSVAPGLNLKSVYNDNVSLRSVNEESSTGYSVSPNVDLKGRELNWEVDMSIMLRAIRYNDVEDADSDNYFTDIGGEYRTELHSFRLDGGFSRNNTFDTDYDTQLPSSGLTDDHTERETTTISPSWQWQTSESSSLSVSLESRDVEYDEVISNNLRDYTLKSATIAANWSVSQRSQLGFNLNYQEYDNEVRSFTAFGTTYNNYLEYENTSYQLNYSYSVQETSSLGLSLGERKLDSISHDQFIECAQYFPLTGDCIVPVYEDVEISDTGAVVSLSYSDSGELSSISTAISRLVVPSSYGGAQEEVKASLIYNLDFTERLNGNLILDATETTAIEGMDTIADREVYRFEPKITWKIDRDWRLGFTYRYLKQDLIERDAESQSNAIYLSLYMTWPRLASTY